MLTDIACFFGGVFLVNGIPHFNYGIAGRPFPTPFAKPPARGNSSPVVNAVWGSMNLAVGYVLLFHVGAFEVTRLIDVGFAGLGGFTMALGLAWHFGSVRSSQA